ncbi:ATP-dependent protease, Lon family [Selenomonas sp. FOBRC9]|uniref:S16 family serine protease n=1 Tax=Selenomonas sp. FOBRC9 TaxID=936573 RepID=UPI00027A636C|nr:S16 family serine protease [Selenomonas sp. FOBRC9]EJP28902.1 ATP-dependent protease, Lon family [Selenomonas sp. FOBRC9]
MSFFKDLFGSHGGTSDVLPAPTGETALDIEIAAIFRMLADMMGTENLVIQAGKMNAMALMRSENRRERVLALMRILEEDPMLAPPPSEAEIPEILVRMTEEIARIRVRRDLEDRIERKVTEKLEQDHEEYVEDIRRQVISEESPGAESPHDKKKREDLEALENIRLTQSVVELLRPQNFDEIIGQERAVRSLMAKLSSPYPQHLLLYGPPGVGKTTAARLVLEAAKKRAVSPFGESAPFVETDGTTLRWDPRDMTNPLLGSVHDPIYQGAQKSLADSGVPEPKPGLVTEAHGGILFIDEIGEMDEMLQNKLLKVLEDKRAYFESAYYDPDDKRVPPYIKKLFEEGAPADFVLIGATTRDADHINPALRSRCAEIYFEPLTPAHILRIVENAARRLHVTLGEGVAELISEYTIEGRKAINILADAYSLAVNRLTDPEIEEIVSRETNSADEGIGGGRVSGLPKKQGLKMAAPDTAPAKPEFGGTVSRETIGGERESTHGLKFGASDTARGTQVSGGGVSHETIEGENESKRGLKPAAPDATSAEPESGETVSRETIEDEGDSKQGLKSDAADAVPDTIVSGGAVSRETIGGNSEALRALSVVVTKDDIYEVVQVSRLYPFGRKKASDTPAVGRVFGLGVAGFLGSIIEIEAVAFPAAEKGKGTVRFNETAGSMAKDSVFNAAAVMRRLTGRDLHDYDIHVNVIGGGNIDGPSAGTAILTAIVSAVTGAPIRQDVAVTGEISLQGEIKPVGGVFEKAYGARQAGITTLIIPWENEKDIPEEHLGLDIRRLKHAEEAFDVLFANDAWKAPVPEEKSA